MRRAASWLVPALALLACAWAASQSVLAEGPTRMSDALPLYLYGAAFDAGLSPVDTASLQQVYEQRGLRVGAALWSTLYPATAGPWLLPLSRLSWEGFSRAWGWILLLSSMGVGLLIPSPTPRSGEDRRLVLGAGLLLAALFLPTTESARLGQINALLAVLCAGALVLAARRRGVLAGLLLGLGASLKLVPVLLAGPLLLGRRWKVPLGGLLLGLPTLAITLTVLPLDGLVQALRDTAEFQDTVAPAWLSQDIVPGWMLTLGDLRHRGLMFASLAIASGLALWRPAPGVLVGACMLLLAWLGTDASAFHILYAPLYLPALVWVATWPLEARSPRWSWALALPLALAALGMPRWELWFMDATVSCVLLGYLAWLGVLARTGWELSVSELDAGPVERLVQRFPLPLAGAAGLTVALCLLLPKSSTGKPPPDSVVIDQDGELVRTGPGFLDPGTQPPGAVSAPAQVGESPTPTTPGVSSTVRPWPEMGPQGSLAKGSRRTVSRHLGLAAWRWEEVARAQPDHAELALDLADWVPDDDLRSVEVGHLARFLAAEGVLLRRLEDEGVEVGPLRGEWSEAVEVDD